MDLWLSSKVLDNLSWRKVFTVARVWPWLTWTSNDLEPKPDTWILHSSWLFINMKSFQRGILEIPELTNFSVWPPLMILWPESIVTNHLVTRMPPEITPSLNFWDIVLIRFSQSEFSWPCWPLTSTNMVHTHTKFDISPNSNIHTIRITGWIFIKTKTND